MENLFEAAGPVCLAFGAATAVAGVAATYYMSKMPDPNCIPPIDLSDQSAVLEDGSRCSRLIPLGEDVEYPFGARTVYEAFDRGIKLAGDEPCLGQRSGPNGEFEWITYNEVRARALNFGSWMLQQGIRARSEQMIGIFSINRPEWVLTEQACACFTILPVALYDTLGDEAIVFIVKQTNMSLVVCDTVARANKLVGLVADLGIVRTIVIMSWEDGANKEIGEQHGITLVSFKEAMAYGKENPKRAMPPKPDDIAWLSYTSGTTGNPKGVILTHGNVMKNLEGITITYSFWAELTKDDVHLSFLPLPHQFERQGQVMLYMHGCRVGFYRGDVKLLLDDLQTLKPTTMFVVPRILNKIYDKVIAGVQSSKLKSWLLQMAVSSKKKELNKFIIRRDSIWDKLLFYKVQALFGGRVRTMVTGSAPLQQKVLDFLRCAFGCLILEGYGQTESAAGLTFTVPGTHDSGHVGPPLPGIRIKLVDCPDEGYFAADGQGEICGKGSSIAQGYFKEPQKTADTFDSDGWLHTGDIGLWLPNGTLKIVDRKKNMFKLCQGEYIAPEKLETTYTRSMYVAQMFVDGNSLEQFPMAIVVPDEEVLTAWAKKQGLSTSFCELCQSQAVKDMILADVTRVGREAGLKSFELVRDIMLYPEMFSVDNGLLTPTFKNKRPKMRDFFKQEIAKLYEKQNTQ